MYLDQLQTIINEPFFQKALIGGVVIAILCALIGVFVVLKREAFLAEAVSHASLTGIGLAFLFGGGTFIFPVIVAIIMSIFITFLKNKTKIPPDSLSGIMFTAFFSLGVLLIYLNPIGRVELESYLFGNLLTLSWEMVVLSVATLLFIGLFIILFYKKLLFITFDFEGARIYGIKNNIYEYIISIFIAVIIIVAVRSVGIILVSALIIIPASSARLFAKSFKDMFFYSLAHNIIAFTIGIFLSIYLPSGPIIVLTSAVIFFILVLLKKIFKLS